MEYEIYTYYRRIWYPYEKNPLNYEIDIICFNLSGAEVWIFLERTKADDTLVLWVTRSLAARVFYTLWCP